MNKLIAIQPAIESLRSHFNCYADRTLSPIRHPESLAFKTRFKGHYTAALSMKESSGLKRFQRVADDRFKMGILLYDGDHTTAFGEHLYTVALGALWS